LSITHNLLITEENFIGTINTHSQIKVITMKIKTVMILMFLLITIGACSVLETPVADTASDTPSPIETNIPVTKSPEPTNTVTTTEIKDIPVSECTLVSSIPDPQEDGTGIFSVKENDWSIGNDDAEITLIEYGDFQ
jgi:hypothetical protein